MTRVVVAAPYPTMPGPESAASFALVRQLVDEGDDVTVVSPQPSAAHHHADPGGPRGAIRLGAPGPRRRAPPPAPRRGRAGRRFVVPGPVPGRLAMRIALRSVPNIEVRLDRVPAPVSAQWADFVLGRARRVLVATADERRGARRRRRRRRTSRRRTRRRGGRPVSAPGRRRMAPSASVPAVTASAADLQDLVRARAAEDRGPPSQAVVDTREHGEPPAPSPRANGARADAFEQARRRLHQAARRQGVAMAIRQRHRLGQPPAPGDHRRPRQPRIRARRNPVT